MTCFECPVCYEESAAPCVFVCGHSFCYQCVKTWYQKGSVTCPMCRSEMCFRGMRSLVGNWDHERREMVLEECVERLMVDDDLVEDSDFLMGILKFVYDRYNMLISVCPDIDHNMIEFMLLSPELKLDVRRVRVYDEVPTYMMYLMVPKTAYGVRLGKG